MRILTRAGRLGVLGALLAIAGCIGPQPSREAVRRQNADADLAAYRSWAPDVNQPVTLALALDHAERYNVDAWVAALERRFQHELQTQSLLKLLPSFMVGVEHSRRNRYDAASSQSFESGNESLEPSFSTEKETDTRHLQATWNLLDFGISFFRARQQANRVAIAAERERRVRQNLSLEVTRAWWQAITAREAARLAAEVRADVEGALERLGSEMAAQTISEIEGLRVQTRLLEQQVELRRYERAYEAARVELATLMGLPPGTEIGLADVDLGALPAAFEVELPALEREALLTRPELYQKDFEHAISRDEALVAIARMFPSLAGYFRYEYNANRFLVYNRWNVAGVRVTWDLLTIPQQLQEHRAFKAQGKLIERQRLALAVAILTQLRLAMLDYDEAREQLEIHRRIADGRQRLLGAIENAAAEGKSHDGEALDHRMKYVKARAKALATQASLMAARARVFNTVGRRLDAGLAGSPAVGSEPVAPEATPAESPAALATAAAEPMDD